jgi:hypothetical protein
LIAPVIVHEIAMPGAIKYDYIFYRTAFAGEAGKRSVPVRVKTTGYEKDRHEARS